MRWVLALAISAARISRSLMALFKFFILEEAMYIVDPIKSRGRSALKSLSPSALRSGSLKSEGLPSGAAIFRSNARLVTIPSLGCRAGAVDTLNAQSIQKAIALKRPVASLLYFLPFCPSKPKMTVMPIYLSLASARNPRANTASAARRSRLSCSKTASKSK